MKNRENKWVRTRVDNVANRHKSHRKTNSSGHQSTISRLVGKKTCFPSHYTWRRFSRVTDASNHSSKELKKKKQNWILPRRYCDAATNHVKRGMPRLIHAEKKPENAGSKFGLITSDAWQNGQPFTNFPNKSLRLRSVQNALDKDKIFRENKVYNYRQ